MMIWLAKATVAEYKHSVNYSLRNDYERPDLSVDGWSDVEVMLSFQGMTPFEAARKVITQEEIKTAYEYVG